LVEFRKIKALTGYHPLNISLTDPLSLTNVTNYSGAVVTFLLIVFICYICYKCATCCAPVFRLFKCIFGGIFALFKKIFDFCGYFKVVKDDIEMTTDSKDDFERKVASQSGHIVWELDLVG
jgi:TctA family transporter